MAFGGAAAAGSAMASAAAGGGILTAISVGVGVGATVAIGAGAGVAYGLGDTIAGLEADKSNVFTSNFAERKDEDTGDLVRIQVTCSYIMRGGAGFQHSGSNIHSVPCLPLNVAGQAPHQLWRWRNFL